MPMRPVWDRWSGSALWKQALRVFLYGVILVGVGVVAALGVDPTFLETAISNSSSTSTSGSALYGHALIAGPARGGGTLVLCGGGGIPEPVRDRFLELAGGPKARIVVIPTANPTADAVPTEAVLGPWKAKSVEWVRVLHTRSHRTANDPSFVQPLTEATGVWLGGGLQSALTDAYLGTAVERQLKALLDRGGVIGGSSAGAAVMTRVMIARGRTKPEVTRGFDLLPGAVVDQHFLRRNRLSRLLSVLSDHPDLIGLGIDERTALVVNLRTRILHVMGDSYVVACVPGPAGQPPRLAFLKPGDETNLVTLKEAEDPSLAIAHPIDLGTL
jgi:cyanophycinase